MYDGLGRMTDETLTVLNDGTGGTSYSLAFTSSSDQKSWLIKFTSGTINNSLPDGQYTLSVLASAVTLVGGGTLLTSNQTFYFHRLYGDFQGTGTLNSVDGTVITAMSGLPVNARTWMADSDGASTIDYADYVAFSNQTDGPYTDPTSTAPIIRGVSGSEGIGIGSGDVAAPSGSLPRLLYYSSQWQVIQENAPYAGTSTMAVQDQQVWGIAYVNELILRDANSTGSTSTGSYGQSGSGLDERVYAEQDANYNVTSLTDTNGNVVERFMYDPYGNVTVTDSNWSTSLDVYSWNYLFQGGRQDGGTGNYVFQRRVYDPRTGTWRTADPAGYINGADRYQFVLSNPVAYLDYTGLNWLGDGLGLNGGAVAGAFWNGALHGAGQGVANSLNGAQSIATGALNLVPRAANFGLKLAHSKHRVPSIPNPDWSNGFFVPETCFDHNLSKYLGGAGILSLAAAAAAAFGAAAGGGAGSAGDAAAGPAEIAPYDLAPADPSPPPTPLDQLGYGPSGPPAPNEIPPFDPTTPRFTGPPDDWYPENN